MKKLHWSENTHNDFREKSKKKKGKGGEGKTSWTELDDQSQKLISGASQDAEVKKDSEIAIQRATDGDTSATRKRRNKIRKKC